MERWYLLISLRATVPGRYLFDFRRGSSGRRLRTLAFMVLLPVILRQAHPQSRLNFRFGRHPDAAEYIPIPPPLLLPSGAVKDFLPAFFLPNGCALPVRRPVCLVFAIGIDALHVAKRTFSLSIAYVGDIRLRSSAKMLRPLSGLDSNIYWFDLDATVRL